MENGLSKEFYENKILKDDVEQLLYTLKIVKLYFGLDFPDEQRGKQVEDRVKRILDKYKDHESNKIS